MILSNKCHPLEEFARLGQELWKYSKQIRDRMLLIEVVCLDTLHLMGYLSLGRFDTKLPRYVIEQLKLSTILEPILSDLRTLMPISSRPILRTHNVVFVPVNSPSQPWHYDHDSKENSYFTILINLALGKNCGGTEIWNETSQRGSLVSI